jgi:uncharacterized delta-60 repeat protein
MIFDDKFYGSEIGIQTINKLSNNRIGVISRFGDFIIYNEDGTIDLNVSLIEYGIITKTISPENISNVPYKIMETSDGNYLILLNCDAGNDLQIIIKIMQDGSIDNSYVSNTINSVSNTVHYMPTADLYNSNQIVSASSSFLSAGSDKFSLIKLIDEYGNLDSNFIEYTYNFADDTSIRGAVESVKSTTDNGILVTGNVTQVKYRISNVLTTYNVGRIYKLHSNGVINTDFNENGVGFNNPVYQIELDNNQNIYAYGKFSQYNNTSCNDVVRLHSNGLLDTSFNAFAVQNTFDKKIGVLEDDTLLVSYYPTLGEYQKIDFAKLDIDGSINTTFMNTEVRNGTLAATRVLGILQSNNKIFIAGEFSMYNISPESNKTPDTGNNFDDSKRTILVFDTNGDIINEYVDTDSIAGGITINNIGIQSNGKLIYGYYRFNADATIDETFTVQEGYPDVIYVQSNDKILAYDPSLGLIRLNSDGTLDTSFNTNSSFVSTIFENVFFIGVDSNGKIIVCGNTDFFDGDVGAIRLNDDGTEDDTFAFNTTFGSFPFVCCAIDPEDRIIIAGYYTNSIEYNTELDVTPFAIRVTSGGVLDNTFELPVDINLVPYSVSCQSDSKVIVAGTYLDYVVPQYLVDYYSLPDPYTIKIRSGHGLQRLNTDGSVDTSFIVPENIKNIGYYGFSKVLVQPDDTIYLTGEFAFYGNDAISGVVKLYSNGARIDDFNDKIIYPVVWNLSALLP